MKCCVCGYKFHYCTNCGFDEDLEPLSRGYCSKKCMEKAGEKSWFEHAENHGD